ncbi:MAG: hypothetical protein IMY76_03680 [Chloroflexi bacterium]|nr:hypothetical protein [Chloroflexota bacterium]
MGTLLPLARQGDIRRLIFNIVGLPLILIGIGGIFFGGYTFLKSTQQIGSLEANQNNTEIINIYTSPEEIQLARRKNICLLLLAWKPGIRWIVINFLVIFVGGFLTRI